MKSFIEFVVNENMKTVNKVDDQIGYDGPQSVIGLEIEEHKTCY